GADVAAEVVEMAVGDEQHVAAVDLVRALGRLRVAEPRVEDDGLATGRLQLAGAVPVPGESKRRLRVHRLPPCWRSVRSIVARLSSPECRDCGPRPSFGCTGSCG